MSPPIDGQRPSSPYVSGSKQALPFDRKPGHPIQNIRETNLKIVRKKIEGSFSFIYKNFHLATSIFAFK